MRKLMCYHLIIIAAFVSGSAFASGYSQALKQYRIGQFKKSIRLSNQALKKNNSKKQKAKLFKLNGLSYFSLGKKESSKKSFLLALKYNPKIVVTREESLSPQAVSFFNKIKSSDLSKKERERQRRKKASKVNRTVIVLNTPAKGTVIIDDIFVGQTGEKIEVKPGLIVATIKAKGFRAKKVKLRVKKNTKNKFNIKLSKIKPKSKKVAKKRRKKRPIRKDDLFAEEDSADPVIKGRDLKQELATEGGGYSAPYTPPPQQYYPPPQQYYPPAPAPQYYPQQQYGYQPTPVPEPYPDPNTGSPSVDYYSDNPRPPGDNYSTNRMAVTSTAQRSFQFKQLLPFGLNLFLDDEILAGSIALTAQAAALGLWAYAFYDEQSTFEAASKTLEEAAENPEYSQEDVETFRRITDEYLAQKQTEQIIYLSLFGVSWISSSIYAYFVSNKKIPNRKQRTRPTYYGKIKTKPSQFVKYTTQENNFRLSAFSPNFKYLGLKIRMDL